MLKFIVKKLLMMIPMLLLISFIVYFGLQLTGIDPINFMVSPEMLSANKENVEALRESLGLNDPLIIQYFRWLGGVLRGDLGYSFDGSSIASILSLMFGVHDPAPHGGFLVLPVVENAPMWVLAIAIGTVVGGILFVAFKKHEWTKAQKAAETEVATAEVAAIEAEQALSLIHI